MLYQSGLYDTLVGGGLLLLFKVCKSVERVYCYGQTVLPSINSQYSLTILGKTIVGHIQHMDMNRHN